MRSAASFAMVCLSASAAAVPLNVARQSPASTVNVQLSDAEGGVQRQISLNGDPFIVSGQGDSRRFTVLSIQANNGNVGALCAAFDDNARQLVDQAGQNTFDINRDLTFEERTAVHAVTCSNGGSAPATPPPSSDATANSNANIEPQVTVEFGVNGNTFATSMIPTDGSIILIDDTNLGNVPRLDQASIRADGVQCTVFSDAAATVAIPNGNAPDSLKTFNNPFSTDNNLELDDAQAVVSIRCEAIGSAPSTPVVSNNANNNANDQFPEDKPWIFVLFNFDEASAEARTSAVWVGEPFNIQGSSLASGTRFPVTAEIRNANGHSGVVCQTFSGPGATGLLTPTFDDKSPADRIGQLVGSILCQ